MFFFKSAYYLCWSLSEIFQSNGSTMIISNWEGNNPDKGIHVLALMIVATNYSLGKVGLAVCIHCRVYDIYLYTWNQLCNIVSFLCPLQFLQLIFLLLSRLNLSVNIHLIYFYFKIFNWKIKVSQSIFKMTSFNMQVYLYDYHCQVNIHIISQILTSKILILKVKVATI